MKNNPKFLTRVKTSSFNLLPIPFFKQITVPSNKNSNVARYSPVISVPSALFICVYKKALIYLLKYNRRILLS